MPELAPRFYPSGSPVTPTSRFGGQPFVIGATALLAIVIGIALASPALILGVAALATHAISRRGRLIKAPGE